ncbi:MAG: protein kinase [Rhodothermales bacterium]
MGSLGCIADIQPFAELAQGVSTVVYKGYQRSLDRFVLLKVLRPSLSHDEERVRRFEDEARLVSQVQHPNVVTVYACGRDAGQVYLAAEYVEGVDVRALLASGPLPVELATFVVLEAAQGLQAAHARGILHRDIKPSNILVSYEGQVKLADFGMASLVEDTSRPEVRGTPGYLAPEIVRGEPPTPASDLFSLGAMFFEVLTARPAFVGAETSALLDAVLHHDPLPRLDRFADLPSGARAICARLLAKDPAERYAGAQALIMDLEAFRAEYGLTAGSSALKAYQEDPSAYRSTMRAPSSREETQDVLKRDDRKAAPPVRRVRHRRVQWVLGIMTTVLLVGGIGGSLYFRDDSSGSPTVTVPEKGPLPEVDPGQPVASGEIQDDDTASVILSSVEPSEGQDLSALPSQDAPPPVPEVSEDTTALNITDIGAPVMTEGATDAQGTLRIDVKPWAVVTIDGEELGESPLRTSQSPGTYEVVLRHPYFPEHRVPVEIKPGEEQHLDVSLWTLVGQLNIIVAPWAEISIDAAVQDTTPLDRPLIVRPGRHDLRLSHPDLGVLDTSFTIRGGEVQTLRFNLNTLLRQ